MRYLLSLILVISFSSVSYSEDFIGGFICDVTHPMTLKFPHSGNDITEPQVTNEIDTDFSPFPILDGPTYLSPILADNAKLAIAYTKDDFGLYTYNNNQYQELEGPYFPNLKVINNNPVKKAEVYDAGFYDLLRVHIIFGYLEITEEYIEYSDRGAYLRLNKSRDDPKLAEGYFLIPPFMGYSYILSLKCTHTGQDITHLINHYK